jgi:DNA-binding MurR/RpiR family transcriptional regulator
MSTRSTALPAKPPTTLKAMHDRVAQMDERLTPRTRDAARYALDHPNDVALNPVAALATGSGIAASAFIRMAQALGFAGFVDMQRLFREPLTKASRPSWRERIRHYGGEEAVDDVGKPAHLLRAFSQANRVSLEHLRDDAHALPLAAAIRHIRRAQVVYVLGLRRSYAVAAYLAYALARVGRPTVQITGHGGAIHEQAAAVSARDVLVAISFPPYAHDTLAVCARVKVAGGKRVAITDTVLSPLARDAHVVLQVNDAELLGFRSLTSAMCLAQTLVMGVAFAEPGRRGRALADIDC